MKINREDMLELTRRMTVKRNCFTRLAGAYMDADGFEEGSFNTHFLKLSEAERERNLRIAKAIPFSETNRQLRLFPFTGRSSDTEHIAIFEAEPEHPHEVLNRFLLEAGAYSSC